MLQFQAALLQRWILPHFMCAFCPFVQILSVNVSVFTLTAIAIDRHRAILKPLRCVNLPKSNSNYLDWIINTSKQLYVHTVHTPYIRQFSLIFYRFVSIILHVFHLSFNSARPSKLTAKFIIAGIWFLAGSLATPVAIARRVIMVPDGSNGEQKKKTI